MEIKKVKWDDCEGDKGALETHDPKKRQLQFFDPAKKGMEVRANYKKCHIHLLITEELSATDFNAKVTLITPFDYTISEPDDLFENDLVEIDREHICWLIGE